MNKVEHKPILEIHGLKTEFKTDRGIVHAVHDVSFSLKKGETLGIVGESGCGKSVTNFSILKLIQFPPGRITDGEVLYKNEDIFLKSDNDVRDIRGKTHFDDLSRSPYFIKSCI